MTISGWGKNGYDQGKLICNFFFIHDFEKISKEPKMTLMMDLQQNPLIMRLEEKSS